MYQIVSIKTLEEFNGTLAEAIERAKAIDAEFQPAYGVEINCDGIVCIVDDDKLEPGEVLENRIDILQSEALAAGDQAQADLCERALDGDVGATMACIRVLSDAEGE